MLSEMEYKTKEEVFNIAQIILDKSLRDVITSKEEISELERKILVGKKQA
jgi:hypothetical protein